MNRVNLENITKDILKSRVALFFGAGVSINSGIPSAHQIISEILKSFKLEQYFQPIVEGQFPFESFMEEVSAFIDIDAFLDVFKIGKPNHFHFLIDELVNIGIVKDILTTNFDTLLEQTITNKDYNLYFEENQFSEIRLNENQFSYVKIHGCVTQKESIRTTMSQIFNRQFRINRNKAINYFFNNKEIDYILIFGYSCSDVIDITPEILKIKNSHSKIIFVEHEDNKNLHFSDLKKHKLFHDFSGFLVKGNTDYIISRMYSLLNMNFKKISHNDKYSHFFEIFMNAPTGVPEMIVGSILFRIGNFQLSKQLLSDSLQKNTEMDKKTRADILCQLTEVYYNIHLNDDLSKVPQNVYEESLNIYNLLGDINGRGEILNHIGHIKTDSDEFYEAEKIYNKAFSCFNIVQNKYRIAQIWNNKARIYMKQYRLNENDKLFDKVENLLSKCYNYFSNSGFINEYAIISYNMGCWYGVKADTIKKAFDKLNESKDLSKNLGDIVGVELCEKEIDKLKTKHNQTARSERHCSE